MEDGQSRPHQWWGVGSKPSCYIGTAIKSLKGRDILYSLFRKKVCVLPNNWIKPIMMNPTADFIWQPWGQRHEAKSATSLLLSSSQSVSQTFWSQPKAGAAADPLSRLPEDTQTPDTNPAQKPTWWGKKTQHAHLKVSVVLCSERHENIFSTCKRLFRRIRQRWCFLILQQPKAWQVPGTSVFTTFHLAV